MTFLIKNNGLLEKYNEMWDKVSNTIKKGLDSEPVYNEKYLKTGIPFYEGKINTNFHGNKVPEESSQCICLSVILVHSVFRTGKNYYPKVFLEECKYIVKKKMFNYVPNDIKISSDDSDKECSDKQCSGKENSDEKRSNEKD